MDCLRKIIMIDKISYNNIIELAKRARYKNISPDYCHFVFQGYRIEAIVDKDNYIICVCKGGSPKKTNDIHNFNNQIIFIRDKSEQIIYNQVFLSHLSEELYKYIRRNKHWFIK